MAVIEEFSRLQVKLIPSKHFQKSGRSRNVTVSDAIEILTSGKPNREPEWNDNYGGWIYFICGKDVEGDDLEVRIGITEDRTAIILVTVVEPH
ncbi:MAG: hypothetical protein C3F08_00145 [Candidatus Methylomirabilota bacterium]|nr:MAG: hypothetical protein C3F08_00145 [candidate division NC10 bacterium]